MKSDQKNETWKTPSSLKTRIMTQDWLSAFGSKGERASLLSSWSVRSRASFAWLDFIFLFVCLCPHSFPLFVSLVLRPSYYVKVTQQCCTSILTIFFPAKKKKEENFSSERRIKFSKLLWYRQSFACSFIVQKIVSDYQRAKKW